MSISIMERVYLLPAFNPIKLIGLKDQSIKQKIGRAVKEIELHRRELENLRQKLEQRRKMLYDTAVRAYKTNDRSKASVYANEWSELRKVVKVVYASELALTQVILRLESIVDVGDVMLHLTTAFKILRKVSKTVNGLVLSLDQASSEISSTLSETMIQMGTVSPNISIDVNSESADELVEQAKKYAEEKAEKIKKTISSPFPSLEDISEGKVELLETGDDNEEEILGYVYSTPKKDVEEQVLKYASIHDGNIDVTDASNVLNIPPDEVEKTVLKLLSEGKVKAEEASES
jgi:division protein CdvB (Snf7/Vps24/ESCRT-III family)